MDANMGEGMKAAGEACCWPLAGYGSTRRPQGRVEWPVCRSCWY